MRDLYLNDLYRYDYDAGIVQRLVYQPSKLRMWVRFPLLAPLRVILKVMLLKVHPSGGGKGEPALRDSDLLSIVSGANSQTVESILREFEAFSALSPGR